MKRGSKIFEESLVKHDIDYFFGIPGGDVMEVIEDLEDVEFVSTRHEECAGFMAAGYGLAKQRPGVTFVRGGPGAANLVISVANAFQCHHPLVAITGQMPLSYFGKPYPQFLDHPRIFETITKKSVRITDGNQIQPYFDDAFTLAASSPPGPVHIDFPMDLQRKEIENVHPSEEKQKDETENADTSELVKLLNKSEFPVLICAWEAKLQGCSQEISQLSERLQMPVLCTRNAMGILHPDDLLFGGIVAKVWKTTLTSPHANWVLEQSDLVIVVGANDFELAPRFPLPSRDVFFISTHPLKIKSQYDSSYEIVSSNLRLTLQKIIKSIPSRQQTEKHAKFVELKKNWSKTLNRLRIQNIGLDLIETVNDVLDRNSVVSLDVGIHAFLAVRHLKIKSSKPGAWLFPGGFYPMGFSFPAAVGAKFADKNNEKTVISLTGDGAFSMVMCDLETLVRYELPMTTIVFNDSAYGLIKFQQLEYDKKIRAVNLTRTDYAKIAEGFGADGIKVDPTDVGSFKAALKEAISSQRPTVIDVDVNTIKVFEDLLEKS
ncbi:thiamine pyrophosphate-binding protein [Candidatus Borrarchaeum sp.]|uniref:thiamine pyrophosphate-binding protein n=1 Tax=Candidatus Borrarchaeum sp. TaxID=2846742 RepID=UPI00257EBDDB|nr:thiamine pyrophosphate-binding protein [Candidatus Borrarchaeum sp.]